MASRGAAIGNSSLTNGDSDEQPANDGEEAVYDSPHPVIATVDSIGRASEYGSSPTAPVPVASAIQVTGQSEGAGGDPTEHNSPALYDSPHPAHASTMTASSVDLASNYDSPRPVHVSMETRDMVVTACGSGDDPSTAQADSASSNTLRARPPALARTEPTESHYAIARAVPGESARPQRPSAQVLSQSRSQRTVKGAIPRPSRPVLADPKAAETRATRATEGNAAEVSTTEGNDGGAIRAEDVADAAPVYQYLSHQPHPYVNVAADGTPLGNVDPSTLAANQPTADLSQKRHTYVNLAADGTPLGSADRSTLTTDQPTSSAEDPAVTVSHQPHTYVNLAADGSPLLGSAEQAIVGQPPPHLSDKRHTYVNLAADGTPLGSADLSSPAADPPTTENPVAPPPDYVDMSGAKGTNVSAAGPTGGTQAPNPTIVVETGDNLYDDADRPQDGNAVPLQPPPKPAPTYDVVDEQFSGVVDGAGPPSTRARPVDDSNGGDCGDDDDELYDAVDTSRRPSAVSAFQPSEDAPGLGRPPTTLSPEVVGQLAEADRLEVLEAVKSGTSVDDALAMVASRTADSTVPRRRVTLFTKKGGKGGWLSSGS